jgi:ABC-type taurine transport system ATPase subunit
VLLDGMIDEPGPDRAVVSGPQSLPWLSACTNVRLAVDSRQTKSGQRDDWTRHNLALVNESRLEQSRTNCRAACASVGIARAPCSKMCWMTVRALDTDRAGTPSWISTGDQKHRHHDHP